MSKVNRFFKLYVFFSLAITGATALSATQEYRIDKFPGSSSYCDGQATEIAKKFKIVTGRTVIGAGCETTFYGQQDLVITYASEQALELVSTWDVYGMERGYYPSAAACTAGLKTEAIDFKENTGLEPVAQACIRTSSLEETAHPFAGRIDSFGTPKFKPLTLEASIYSIPVDNLGSLATRIKKSLKEGGIASSHVLVDYGDAFYRLFIRYYAARELPISLTRMASYANIAACTKRMTDVKEVLAKAKFKSFEAFCARDELSPASELYILGRTEGSFKKEKISKNYASLAGCDADRERVIKLYQDELDRPAVGAFCSEEQDTILNPGGIFMFVFLGEEMLVNEG